MKGLISGKGIKVDLMFPNLTYPITDILADMMKRGVLFVINVSLLDEQNRTATVLRLKENTTKSFPVAEAINFVISKYKEISTPLSLQNQDSRVTKNCHLFKIRKILLLIILFYALK